MAEQRSKCPWKTRTKTIYTESTTKEEKNWICDEVLKEGKSIKEVANNHGIKYDTMQKWVRKVKIGREVRGGRAGRPMALSQQQQELVRQKIGSDGKYSDDVDEIIWKATCDTARERKNDLPKDPISKNTKRKYFEMLGVDKFKVEITSKARKIAVADVANFITLAAVNYEMIKVLDTPEELILNIDATQYQVGSTQEKTATLLAIQDDTEVKKKPKKAVARQGDNNQGTALFVKYFCLINAVGDLLEPIFIIADDTMVPGKFHPYRVKNLGVGTGPGCSAWLVFCNTRCCNIAFFRWLFTVAIIEAIQCVRNVYELPDQLAWLQLDGEPIQIKCFEEPEVLKVMEVNNTTVSKLPASTTEASQPCDRGNLFKGSKTKLKYIKDRHINKENCRRLIEALHNVIEQHKKLTIQEHRKDTTPGTGTSATDTGKTASPEPNEDEVAEIEDDTVPYKPLPHSAAVINGLLRVQAAISKSCTKHAAQESFQKTGIFPFNVNQMFENCTTKVESNDKEAIVAALPTLGSIIGSKGELLGEEIVQATGLDLPGISEKDNLVVYRRRSILLTNPQFVAKQQKIAEEKRVKKEQNLSKKLANANKKNGTPSEEAKDTPKRRGRAIGSKNKKKDNNNNNNYTAVQA